MTAFRPGPQAAAPVLASLDTPSDVRDDAPRRTVRLRTRMAGLASGTGGLQRADIGVHAVLIGGEGRILVAGSARIQKEQGHAAFLRQHQHGVGGELAFAYQQGRFVAGDFLHNSHEPRRRGGLLLIFLHNIDNGDTGIVGQIGQRIVVQDNARGKGRSGIFQPGRKPVEAIGIGGGIGGNGCESRCT